MPLAGFKKHLETNYGKSVFDEATSHREIFNFYCHSNESFNANVKENMKYDVLLKIEGSGEEKLVKKHDIKFLHSEQVTDSVSSQLKIDPLVKKMRLEPTENLALRNHVKNKSLYVLMNEREVLFFTLMEGEQLRGIIQDFSRYEITLLLKGGVPVTVFRHSIYDLRNKKGRCFLKRFQEKHKDWKKSSIYGEV